MIGKEADEMKRRIIFGVCVAIALWVMVETNVLVAQGHYATLTGTVVGVHRGIRKYLDVKSDKDQAAVDFRIGKRRSIFPIATLMLEKK